jgi:hypoxanthine-guanine phosphoribosyltransferase
MTVKSVKLQLERAQEEIALLNEKVAILEDIIDKLKTLNYIQEKYNIPGN